MTTALSYHEALSQIVQSVSPLPVERLPLEETVGRALAERIVSPVALPPWDNAGMDGYAVQRADIAGRTLPMTLRVSGTAAAGADPHRLPVVHAGHAVRIMTGAPLPPGADAVIRVEDTDRGTDVVQVRDARDIEGRGNIRPRGEDVAADEVLFTPGITLNASHLGVLASVGQAVVAVHRQPRVTVLSSGDELVLLDRFAEVREGRRIVASSTYALPPLLRAAGAQVTVAPLVPDTLQDMMAAIDAAVTSGCDLLVTTGGVSVGAHDYTREALVALGGQVDFWRARIRPGGPIGTGHVRGVPWVGLPGNPVSTMVTGALFAWPLIKRLGGHERVHHRLVPVVMQERFDTPAALTYFVRVTLARGADGRLEAHLAGAQGSNLMRTMAAADALLIVPESCAAAMPGEVFDAVLLP